MNDLQNIQSLIYEVRGARVMLDRDLAILYGVETRVLNQAVKRNIERFPEDFMFRLTKGENEILINHILGSQFVTANSFTKSRYLPYAFTEQGVAMLSSVLRSPLAIQVNIGIIRAFVEFRRLASALPVSDASKSVVQLRKDFEELKLDIEEILHDQNDINESTRLQLDNITMALAELQAERQPRKKRKPIGFTIPQDNED
ncbi:MAG: ORF6N domain-containing protein [Prevotella sp.]|nr:ORF6N domain-containing protein [Prevotella sp.]